jgi:16S rRNA (adenine1518-N6/adenine1519-N6)-dimethyltransferase
MDPAEVDLPRLEVASLLRQFGLRPKQGLGQNFLAAPGALRSVVAAAEIPPDADVLEVGPGLGHLTRYLARAARRVVAVELDPDLIPVLSQVLAKYGNVTVVQGDILALDPAGLMGQAGYLVVANIPYYITSALIRHLLEGGPRPAQIVLTIQSEVAERICAPAGEMSLLALGVQVYGRPQITARIPAGAFYPPPRVDSAVLKIELFPEPLIPVKRIERFFQLCKAGFSQKRKTLRNSLSAGLRLPPDAAAQLLRAAGIDPQRRAETLSLAEWAQLLDVDARRA